MSRFFSRVDAWMERVVYLDATSCLLQLFISVLIEWMNGVVVDVAETTEDKMFTLTEVECLGACVNAPMIQLNDDYVVSQVMCLVMAALRW